LTLIGHTVARKWVRPLPEILTDSVAMDIGELSIFSD
jgi:hypothetical protein